MKKTLLCLVAAAVAPLASAADVHTGRMEACMKAALAKFPGEVTTLEAEIEKGRPIYEFDITDKDGRQFEVECDARTGRITETEEEVASADVAAFRDKAKVSLEEAKKIALAKRPGEIIETEFSLENDGSPSYEFDIRDAAGKEWEIEVDAVTGKILEEEQEIFQVGAES